MVAICATSHKGHNTKNEAVLLFVVQVHSDFWLTLYKQRQSVLNSGTYLLKYTASHPRNHNCNIHNRTNFKSQKHHLTGYTTFQSSRNCHYCHTKIVKRDIQMTLHKHTKTHSSLGVVNASGSTQRLGYHSNANFPALICFTVRFIATEPQTANEWTSIDTEGLNNYVC